MKPGSRRAATSAGGRAPGTGAVASAADAVFDVLVDATTSRVAEAFAATLVRLHRQGGGDPAQEERLAATARDTWLDAAAGHTCRPAGPAPIGSPMIVAAGAGGDTAPLVVDRGHVYLQRLWFAECRLAAALNRLVDEGDPARPAVLAPVPLAAATLGGLDKAQRRFVTLACTSRFAVLTGGPGTGKTSTLARVLYAIWQVRPDARIAIAAPTGKAAGRLAQAIGATWSNLAGLLPPPPLPGITLHALLGIRGPAQRPAFDSRRPLPYDIVVVDEASMIDLELADALVDAIGPATRLLLAGDRDQLGPVEAGAVFAEICEVAADAPRTRRRGIGHHVVVLETNYRQREAASIVALAGAIRSGDRAVVEAAADVFRIAPDGGHDATDDTASIVADAVEGYRPVLAALERQAPAPEVLAACDSYRVLCALREGPRGTKVINERIARVFRRARDRGPLEPWYEGRLVMVTRNRAELGLFNGDVGIVLATGGGLAVAFPGEDAPRWVPVAQMPACEDAWAITVHKSQGSEFDAVSLVPAPAGHPLSTRELIYTGVTRARRRLILRADAGVLADAAGRPLARIGQLASRLAASAG